MSEKLKKQSEFESLGLFLEYLTKTNTFATIQKTQERELRKVKNLDKDVALTEQEHNTVLRRVCRRILVRANVSETKIKQLNLVSYLFDLAHGLDGHCDTIRTAVNWACSEIGSITKLSTLQEEVEKLVEEGHFFPKRAISEKSLVAYRREYRAIYGRKEDCRTYETQTARDMTKKQRPVTIKQMMLLQRTRGRKTLQSLKKALNEFKTIEEMKNAIDQIDELRLSKAG